MSTVGGAEKARQGYCGAADEKVFTAEEEEALGSKWEMGGRENTPGKTELAQRQCWSG